MPKKASEDYIHYRKKLCNFKLIKGINELSEAWMIPPTDVCTRLITEGVVNELRKKREIDELKKTRQQ